MGDDLHCLEIESVDGWVGRSADLLGEAIQTAVADRDRCLLALSGGSTPKPVFNELATRDLPWEQVVILQADERVVAAGIPERNLTQQREAFQNVGASWLPLPVDELLDPDDGAAPPPDEVVADSIATFSAQLVRLADDPPIIDIAQLGLGTDGHTASLVPGDPTVDELRRFVALTGEYQGCHRLTLTRPLFDRARLVIWLVRGADKAEPLGRLLAGDLSIPAGLLRPRNSVIVADVDAARQV